MVFAINHAATALLVKKRFPAVPWVIALVSVQLVEFLWVFLHYAGVERTGTEDAVRYVGDIHLSYMPFSHSVATTLALVVLSVLVGTLVGRRAVGIGVAAGIASHLILDILTHDHDIALAPGTSLMIGTGLYVSIPWLAFIVELSYGILCWRVVRGSRALLVVIIGFNLANVSLFFQQVPGPEGLFAHRPLLLVSVILVQIVVTLFAVGVTAPFQRSITDATATEPGP